MIHLLPDRCIIVCLWIRRPPQAGNPIGMIRIVPPPPNTLRTSKIKCHVLLARNAYLERAWRRRQVSVLF